MIFLSLGAGVQSSVMLMLAIRGEIERPDHVIFADTGFEPRAVYEHLEWCKKQCLKAELPIHVVKATMDMREEFEAYEAGEIKHMHSRPPLYMTRTDGKGPGWPSIRQCTGNSKVEPLARIQKKLMGHKTERTIADGECILQIGISTDEARRASPSRVRWIEHSYPLIDPLKMSRSDCQSWWERNYPHHSLPSSSCVICPYKTNRMWAAMKRDTPEDFAVAVEYDKRFRAAYERRTGQSVYVSREFKPLDEVSLGEGQQAFDLEDEIYCAGGCGL